LTAPEGVKNQEKASKRLICFTKAYLKLPAGRTFSARARRFARPRRGRRDADLRQGAGDAWPFQRPRAGHARRFL